LLAQTNPGLLDEGIDLAFEVSCIDLGFEINRIGHCVSPPRGSVLYHVRDGAPQRLLNR
jgi:hypothetical protein